MSAEIDGCAERESVFNACFSSNFMNTIMIDLAINIYHYSFHGWNVLIPKLSTAHDELFFYSMNKSRENRLQVVITFLSFIFFHPTCFLIFLRSPRTIQCRVLERPSAYILLARDSWHLVTSAIYWINIDAWTINHCFRACEGRKVSQRAAQRKLLRNYSSFQLN